MTDGSRRSRAGVERGERVAQPPVYILVHLDVAVGGEVVGVGQPFEPWASTSACPVGGARHAQRSGTGGPVRRTAAGPRPAPAARSRVVPGSGSVSAAFGTASFMPRRYRERLG
ncbi:hypothetical protein GCM10019016_110720 [Streptomyces prasinosporus]|uniref:Uncharacterized protein n=1 Tax=Streptomyces prasinosporus TaxID=68256 RepID=A0ABP6UBN9_9ACTN